MPVSLKKAANAQRQRHASELGRRSHTDARHAPPHASRLARTRAELEYTGRRRGRRCGSMGGGDDGGPVGGDGSTARAAALGRAAAKARRAGGGAGGSRRSRRRRRQRGWQQQQPAVWRAPPRRQQRLEGWGSQTRPLQSQHDRSGHRGQAHARGSTSEARSLCTRKSKQCQNHRLVFRLFSWHLRSQDSMAKEGRSSRRTRGERDACLVRCNCAPRSADAHHDEQRSTARRAWPCRAAAGRPRRRHTRTSSAPAVPWSNGFVCSWRARRMEETEFRRCNARAEPCGALARDSEDQKRCTVSGSIGCLIEPDPMDTSPTTRADGIGSRRPSRCLRRGRTPLPRDRPVTEKRTIYMPLIVLISR